MHQIVTDSLKSTFQVLHSFLSIPGKVALLKLKSQVYLNTNDLILDKISYDSNHYAR